MKNNLQDNANFGDLPTHTQRPSSKGMRITPFRMDAKQQPPLPLDRNLPLRLNMSSTNFPVYPRSLLDPIAVTTSMSRGEGLCLRQWPLALLRAD